MNPNRPGGAPSPGAGERAGPSATADTPSVGLSDRMILDHFRADLSARWFTNVPPADMSVWAKAGNGEFLQRERYDHDA